jgi:plastocyanin
VLFSSQLVAGFCVRLWRVPIGKLAFVCAVAMALWGMGCSSGSGGGSSCSASSATDLTGQDPFQIQISSFAYHPSCFVVHGSQSMKLVNGDSVPHTFTVNGTSVDVKVDAGQTLESPPAGLAADTYQFRCTIHPQMTGTLIVK